jgi:4-O-beta-D-mannosyl-D-glucose phosphorylase
VATSTMDRILDYVLHTPADGFSSAASVNTLNTIINNNKTHLEAAGKTKAGREPRAASREH